MGEENVGDMAAQTVHFAAAAAAATAVGEAYILDIELGTLVKDGDVMIGLVAAVPGE